jgi:type I restriction enzyme, S subunit
MSSEWPRFTVAELQAAGQLLVEDGNHGEYRPRPDEFAASGVSFIRAADMADGRVLFESAAFINEVANARIRKGRGKPGDVLLSHKGTVGKVALVPNRCPSYVCSPQTTFWRVLKDGVIDRRYLFTYLQSQDFKNQLASRKGETDMADYVSLTAQRQLTVPLPSIEVQRAIGDQSSMLLDRITLLRETNATLEAIAQALFKSWFVDFDPVRAKMAGRVPEGMAEATAALFPDALEEAELGLVPKGWSHQPIADMVGGVYDGPHATPPEAESGGVFLGIKNLTGTALDLTEIRFIGEAEWAKWTKRVEPRAGDIVFSYEATLGFFALIPPDLRCCLGRRLALIRPKDEDGAGHFWFHQFVAPPFQALLAKHTIQGATVNRIALKEFPSYPVLVPPPPLRMAFHDVAVGLWSKIQGNQAQAQTFTALRDTLLPRLISGQLRLPDAQHLIEEAC